jgi:predicted nuclease of restriction endonuclease-like (RecB) superfamily
MKRSPREGKPPGRSGAVAAEARAFAEVVELIRASRGRALAAVNTTLIELYWQVGESISRRIQTDGWGKGTVAALSSYIQERQPGIRGFSPQNLWRMRQFFEAYRDHPDLSTLSRVLPWSSNLHILTKAKRPEERELYLRMAATQRWPVREVARELAYRLYTISERKKRAQEALRYNALVQSWPEIARLAREAEPTQPALFGAQE